MWLKITRKEGEPLKNFYTAGEAMTQLGMTKSAFFYLVRKGTINKVVMPGKKQGLYPKTDIDRLAATIKTTIEMYEQESSVFDVATLDDLQVEYEMDIALLGRGATTAIEARRDRLRKNPEGNYVLRNAGMVVGYFCFYPLPETIIEDRLHNRIEGAIPIEKFGLFEPGHPLHVHIFMIGVRPGYPPDVAKHYGQRLIAGVVDIFRQFGERGINIVKLYAVSHTPYGIALCRKLGMEEEEMEGEPGHYRFRLDVATSTSMLVQEYKRAYDEYPAKKL